MVLNRIALIVIALAGCGQSLFDSRGDIDGGAGGGDGIDGPVAAECPAPCLADAAVDFDGSPTGASGKWRYLEDRRNRMWTPMTATGNVFAGADPANKITSCAEQPSAPACAAIPGALLVSSAGATGNADPALEVTVGLSNVYKLTLRVHVPAGSPEQVVRIYRNSREDVLVTATAMPGATLDREIVLDGPLGDRYLIALAPEGFGASDVAVQMFLSGTGVAYPQKCQLGLNFSAAMGTNVDNYCGADLSYNDDTLSPGPEEVPPLLGMGPFPELGQAADIAMDHYYKGTDLLDRTGDSTIQMWIKHDALVPSYGAWVYSDEDLNAGGGLGAVIYNPGPGGLNLDVVTVTDPNTSPVTVALETVPYPTDRAWHFLRITHSSGMVKICIDGRKLGDLAVPAAGLVSTFAPHIGRNVRWSPQGAFFDGSIDDVRAFKTALVCE